jgi:hypothetical protein
MIKLLFAHICDTAFISEGSKNLNIIGIFENIGTKKFPAVHPKFSVVSAIQGDEGDYTQTITITNKLTGQEIRRISGPTKISKPNGKAIFIGTLIMTTFPSLGSYLVNISINEENIGSLEFNVTI